MPLAHCLSNRRPEASIAPAYNFIRNFPSAIKNQRKHNVSRWLLMAEVFERASWADICVLALVWNPQNFTTIHITSNQSFQMASVIAVSLYVMYHASTVSSRAPETSLRVLPQLKFISPCSEFEIKSTIYNHNYNTTPARANFPKTVKPKFPQNSRIFILSSIYF